MPFPTPNEFKIESLDPPPSSETSEGRASFPIVGIGASAGGLEAIRQFLGAVPANSGLAYVVIQHLDPTQIGMLPELLQRSTELKVMQVTDQTRLSVNCVYVIPPNTDMSVLNGVLHLHEPAAPRGLRLPIDSFFRSLADDQQERSIGVILSGMGTDGTLGLQSIKEHGGLALVQDPLSAKFDGMPRSAMSLVQPSIVAPAAELPGRILGYLRHLPVFSLADKLDESDTSGQFEKAVLLIRSHTGHDFSLYKRSTILRRIERRMGLHKLGDISQYVRFLRENPIEIDLLFKEMLIGVTRFFRDPEFWHPLLETVLPELLSNQVSGRALRGWVAGCSTGEEAYSLAIAIKETMEIVKSPKNLSVQIFATDIDAHAIQKARRGFFPSSIADDLSEKRLSQFFLQEGSGYRVKKEIREMVIFAAQNVIMDPPFTKLDILTCRNLLIYLRPELQSKLIPLFHYSLKPGGVLILGSAESVGGFTDLFVPLHSKSRVFHRQESSVRRRSVDFPTAYVSSPLACPVQSESIVVVGNLQSQAEQWLLKYFAPAAVIVSDQGDILYISGRTGRYLEAAAGKANWNIFVMARENLRYELAKAVQRARGQKEPVVVRCSVCANEAERVMVGLTVQVVRDDGVLKGLTVIVFSDHPAAMPATGVAKPKKGVSHVRISELEFSLQQARDEVQIAREDMQTTREELTSVNEELQSTNEELQSTNEELTTSKEEMQSLNEELQTVNAELQAKLDELSATSNDMKNLLNSTEIATVFLDDALKVRRFTDQVTEIIKLIPTDVGRPVTDLAISLLYPELADDAREVLRTLIPIDKALVSKGGRWFATRLMPYRTFDNRINGVVITFTDMTVVKRLEANLQVQREKSE